jgi:glycosyltransferase involved in cell wall biosynthesis
MNLLKSTPTSVLGLVSYKVFPVQMGGQKCVAGFYTHLSKKITVILAAAKENKAAAGLPYPVLPFLYNHWLGFLNLGYLYKLSKLIKEKKISLLILEHSYFGWLGLLLRRINKIPVVIRSHNIEALRFRDLQKSWWRIYGWYEKKVHRRVDHSFFITAEDKSWAITHWHLDEKKCSVLTYGTDIMQPALSEEKKQYRESLLAKYSLDTGTRLFFFNGSLDYLPNTDALRIIISEIIPLLISVDFSFRIIVCGRGLNEQWKEVLGTYPNIIYAGFEDDITPYYKGADCFINPVTLGSGIKIKLVEALAFNQTAISTKTGAKGISKEIAGKKLVVLDDYDWYGFAAAMVKTELPGNYHTPESFYTAFNWDTIIQKALLSLQPNE